jgi:hypothetical protein
MESDQRYFARRACEEFRAAERAVTPAARARRQALAESFAAKAQIRLGAAGLELVEG